MRQRKGITLLEMLVTIVIVGIAAAVFVPSYNKMAEDRNRKEAEMTLYKMLDAVHAQQRQHPQALTNVNDVNEDWIYNWQNNLKNYMALPSGEADTNTWVTGTGNKQVRYFMAEDNGLLRLVAQFHDANYIYLDFNGQFGNQSGHTDGCTYNSECNDLDPCTQDVCNSSHICEHPVDSGHVCDDGDPCTLNEQCNDSGACTGGTTNACDDRNGCTTDSCNSESGCLHVPLNDSPCSDANACTSEDHCVNGVCSGSSIVCEDDGNPCTSDECDVISGCVHPNLPSGTSCSDHDICNGLEVCENGACLPGTDLVCDDSNPCTDNTCDPQDGCVITNDDTNSCSDNNLCNGHETCQGGSCVNDGQIVECNDNLFCNGQSLCLPLTGQCDISSMPCPFGQYCDEDNDRCVECLDDSHCDDNKFCTIDTCNNTGKCEHAPNPCNDGNDCTIDDNVCNEEEDKCENFSINGAPCVRGCRAGICDLAGECALAGDAPDGTYCDDENVCTNNDKCSQGNCVGEQIPDCEPPCDSDDDCNDQNFCTKDTCVDAKCTYLPQEGELCDDENPCTINEKCTSQGTCDEGQPNPCNDNNECTTDSCDSDIGCKHADVTNGTECMTDNLFCTVLNICQSGTCTGSGTPCSGNTPICDEVNDRCICTSNPQCNDGNTCTTDTCTNNVCVNTNIPKCVPASTIADGPP